MIEKLNLEEVNNPGEATLKAFSILNQLVDAVNELQTTNTHIQNDLHKMRHSNTKTRAENVQDKFAEQCKWIGKLCKFWDGDEQISHLRWGILYEITPTSPLPFCCSLGDGKTFDYEHCEPVKPDDDIIYKGGDNE